MRTMDLTPHALDGTPIRLEGMLAAHGVRVGGEPEGTGMDRRMTSTACYGAADGVEPLGSSRPLE